MLKNSFKIIYHYLMYYDERTNYKARFLIWCNNKNCFKWFCHILRQNLAKKNHIIFPCKPQIGSGLVLAHPQNIVIGQDVKIGNNCLIYQDVTIGQNHGIYPSIGDNVIIYPGAKVIGDVTVGNNVVIGANAVVTSDIQDNAIVAGIPAKFIRFRERQDEFN